MQVGVPPELESMHRFEPLHRVLTTYPDPPTGTHSVNVSSPEQVELNVPGSHCSAPSGTQPSAVTRRTDISPSLIAHS
jgi:hypothetical protein